MVDGKAEGEARATGDRADASAAPGAAPAPPARLWWLTISPGIWALHFLASYLTAAIWCAKLAGREGSLGGARIAIAAYTVVALAAVATMGLRSHRRHATGTATVPHDFDTPEDRTRFLGFASLLLSLLSAVAIVFAALPLLFIETCR